MKKKGYEIWRLWRGTSNSLRTLVRGETTQELRIEDSGFVV